MPLVEVVVGRETDAGTADRAEAIVERWGKTADPLRRLARVRRQPHQPPVHARAAATARGRHGHDRGDRRGDARRGLPAGPVRAHRPDRPRRQPRHLDRRARRPRLDRRGSPRRRSRSASWPRAASAASAASASTSTTPRATGSARARASAAAVASTCRSGRRRSRAASGWPSPTRRTSRSGTASPRRTGSTSRFALGAAHPQGPLEWAIAQGLDAVHAELKALEAAEGEQFAPAPALVEAAATR